MIQQECSAIAAASGEPVGATASRLRNWLLIEQPGRWGHDALLESALPADIGLALKERGEASGVRVLLLRRRDRPIGGPRRCFAAFTGRRERRLATFEVRDPRELLDLDLRGLVRRRWTGFGTPVTAPLFVICTHGKHDACCARYGAPAARALLTRPDVWEATHVGGDRFAGNLVCFPHGLYFGRLRSEEARAAIAAYERGRILLSHYRGRSSYPPAVQAAEDHLRRELGLDGIEDLVLAGHDTRGRQHSVAFALRSGERRTVRLRETALPERILTCKGTHPRAPRAFDLLA